MENNQVKVEVCAFSLESCINAQKAGAQRIELCGGLFEGGTTPSAGLISIVKNEVDLELFAMVRPRGGDFFYSIQDKKVMMADIKAIKSLGADGIVLGLLKKNGEVDIASTKEMVEVAFPMQVTFHRAFDVAVNPFEALEAIIESCCVRILTSGHQNTAIKGIELIGELVKKAQNRIEIMAGSGVNALNTPSFLDKKVNAIHLTGKSIRQSSMDFRNENVSMSGIEGFSDFDIAYSDVEKIKSVVEIIKDYKY